MRANFGFIAAGFMLINSAFALPLEASVNAVAPDNKDVTAIASRPTPNCKSRYFVDMCLNADIKETGSLCDGGGNFQTKIPACVFPTCWCE